MVAMAVMGAVAIGGALLKAKGAKDAAKAQKEAAEEEERRAKEHAQFAEENAEIIAGQARAEVVQIDRAIRLKLGAIRAAAGASGGRVNMGSVVDIVSDVAAQGELEKQNALFSGFLGGRSERQTAKGFQSQALLASMRGKAASKAGTLGAASALLGGVSSVMGMFGGGAGGIGGGA